MTGKVCGADLFRYDRATDCAHDCVRFLVPSMSARDTFKRSLRDPDGGDLC